MVHQDQYIETESTANAGSLVMVCGASRSGTSMLDAMLGNADDVFSAGEIYNYFRPHMVHHFQPVCSCGQLDCAAWRGLLDVPEEEFHAGILNRPEYNLVIDSSKDLRWVLDSNVWADRNGIACSHVVIWKDPVDLAYSYWKRGGNIRTYRRQFLVYYERFLKMGLPFIGVNYNDLASNVEKVLPLLCSRLGIPYSAQRARFWESDVHYFFGSPSVRKQASEGRSTIANKRDFPQDFLSEYEPESRWSESDARFMKVVEILKENDVSNSNPAYRKHVVTGLKPAWYYRHIIKALVFRYFPRQLPNHD